jgi:2-dehydro-3-deoxygluconokinase
MHYYRSGSAASAMGPDFLDRPAVRNRLASADLVHTTGITAALSEETAAMLDRLAALRDALGFVLSVDLNWRPALWRDKDPAPLWRLLRAADVVLIGADEAMLFAGTSDPDELRDLMGPRATIVVKSDAQVALALEPAAGPGESGRAVERRTEVPALTVDVVEPVGAGDAFAAGFLAAMLEGLPMEQRLRSGHLSAAAVLTVPNDHAVPPEPSLRQALLQCPAEEWAETRVGPMGVTV